MKTDTYVKLHCFRKKPWCPTRSHEGHFWGQVGRGRCRLDCDGQNLDAKNVANLATEVSIYLFEL